MLLALASFIGYGLFRWCASMNYIQAKINSECQKAIEEAITNAFRKSIVNEMQVKKTLGKT